MQELSELIESAQRDFAAAQQPAALEDAKAKYIGKTGYVTQLMKQLRSWGGLRPARRDGCQFPYSCYGSGPGDLRLPLSRSH